MDNYERYYQRKYGNKRIVAGSEPPEEGLTVQKGAIGKSLRSKLLALLIAGLAFVTPKLPILVTKGFSKLHIFRQQPQVESVRHDPRK